MIKEIRKVNYPTYKLAYDVYGEDFQLYGSITLSNRGNVDFHVDDISVLELEEVAIIFELMDRINKINQDKELDTLQEAYFYGIEPRQTESPDKTS